MYQGQFYGFLSLRYFYQVIEDLSSITLLFYKRLTVSTRLMRQYEGHENLWLSVPHTHLFEGDAGEVWLIKTYVLGIFENYFLHLLSSRIHYLYLGMFVCSESRRLAEAPN